MKISLFGLGVALVLLCGGYFTPALAETGSDPCEQSRRVCGSGSDDGFTLGAANGQPGTGVTDGRPAHPVVLSATYVIHKYSPTCSGNTLDQALVLCPQAVLTCLPQRAGLIQYWQWDITVDRATGKPIGQPVIAAQPKCLDSNVADLPPVAAIGGIVASEFDKLIVLKGDANVTPKGTTLVNYENGYYTKARQYVLDPVQILGHTVVVTAIPQSYDWFFGDGTTARHAGPGVKGTKTVHHTYTRTGAVAPYVVITWTGTFTVDGGAANNVFGTATTTGPGTPLQVKQARAELVAS